MGGPEWEAPNGRRQMNGMSGWTAPDGRRRMNRTSRWAPSDGMPRMGGPVWESSDGWHVRMAGASGRKAYRINHQSSDLTVGGWFSGFRPRVPF
nr:hypothetical protein [Tanacetum cinerariifolium]